MGQSVEFVCALWSVAQNLVMCIGSERRIWLFTMAMGTEFGDVLLARVRNLVVIAVAQNLVMCYGPERGISCALWVMVQNLVMCNRSERRIWLCTISHGAEFGYVLWARAWNFFVTLGHGPWAQNLVTCYGPERKE